MEDTDGIDKIENLNLGEIQKNDSIYEQNDDNDKYLLERESLSENSSNNNSKIIPRFTKVDNNFSMDQSDYKDDSDIISQNSENPNENDSKNQNLVEKKKNKLKNKKIEPAKNFINLKLILVGDVSVGKTSIIGRYIDNKYKENYECTIQAEQRTKIIEEDSNTFIRLNVWDTAGQEKYRAITRQYYNNCDGAFIIFDLTKRNTFECIPNWIKEINEYGNKDAIIMILGNKLDLIAEREIPPNDIKNFVKNNYLYYEVSAKNGNNIFLSFDKMKKLIMENRKEDTIQFDIKDRKSLRKSLQSERNSSKSKSLNEFDKKNKKCC